MAVTGGGEGAVRLTPQTADQLPAVVRRPGFDRKKLQPRMLHLGDGAFHRCHQVEWTDDACEAAGGDWGSIGLNLRPPDLGVTLGAQGGLFCRELREDGQSSRRLLGSEIGVMSVLDAAHDPRRLSLQAALATAMDPALRLVTLTITEKGYCHVPATGQLDGRHHEIVHDAAHPDLPVSAPGFLLAMLRARLARGLPLPAMMSCDNVPDNGTTLRNVVLGLAALSAPDLVARLERDARFLNTMVDRIVPATRTEDIARFAAETGVLDHGLVVGEPFRMWVIEDRHETPMPDWRAAGALVVDDVRPYELVKMRVLNGIQSNVAQLGVLAGIGFMADLMARPEFAAFARRTIAREVLPLLPEVGGIDLDAYLDQSLRRLTNADLRHATAQIATDSSQKIRQRLLEPLRACVAAGRDPGGLLLGVAGWMCHAGGRLWTGEPIAVNDPLAAETRAVGDRHHGDAPAFVAAMLAIETVFGTDLARQPEVAGRLAGFVERLWAAPADQVVRQFLKEAGDG